ncbi:MAG: hypothetical protein ACRD2P_07380 [Terriglobia bacterium]
MAGARVSLKKRFEITWVAIDIDVVAEACSLALHCAAEHVANGKRESMPDRPWESAGGRLRVDSRRAHVPAFLFHLVKPAKFQPPRRRAPSGVIPVAT